MIVSVEQFGVKPEPGHDNTFALRKALDYCKGLDVATLVFPEGCYHFWPDQAVEKTLFISNHDQEGIRRIAFLLSEINEFTIDGQGSEFIFHGPMIPFFIDHCRNTRIQNVIIDWDEPMFGQGVVTSVGDDSFDVKIHGETTFKVEDNNLWFAFGGKQERVWGINEFDPRTKAPAYQSGDKLSWGSYNHIRVKSTESGSVMFYGEKIQKPKVGNVVIMRFGRRENPAFFLKDGENIHLNSVDVYHAPGMGLIAQKCTNISLDHFNVQLKPGGERFVTATADATHFVYCRGKISMNHCLFENQLDDPCNVHGIYARIAEKKNKHQLLVELVHGMAKGIEIASPGDILGFVSRESLLTYANVKAAEVEMINKDYLLFTFEQPLPEMVQINDVIENLSWSSDLIVTNSVVRANRARGFLITTAGNVLLEHNQISAPGSGIKISGDANYWFESGAVKQIVIRNNEFLDCNYCCPDWGRAVIDIDPEIEHPEKYEGCFHRNIRIEGNQFSTFDTGIVYGRSIDGLVFTQNVIKKSNTYPPHQYMKHPIQLEASKNVTISDNRWMDDTAALAEVNGDIISLDMQRSVISSD
ncbi:hypothetical protein V7087_26580 [Neobacillus niacini]|uniref:alpha-1,3-galactosidase-related protein n=1 Tax=Neobacillus niacini TaxID=86668 RepID=UPI002FFD5AA5